MENKNQHSEQPNETGHAPIFLYLKSCKLSDRSLKKLNAAGYITIGVESFESVKIAEPLLFGSSKLAKAAYHTIMDSGYDSTRAKFGGIVAKALSDEL